MKCNNLKNRAALVLVLFSIRQVMDKRLAYNLETHLIFIDLRKVYDRVTLSKLWSAMEKISK